MALINFFYEDVDFKLSTPRKRASWIEAVVKVENSTIEHLNFIFCSDSYLLEKNIEFLDHHTYTDIITFSYAANFDSLLGDIFISVDRVFENSVELKIEFEDELDRVMIHGVLHLLGYEDKTSKQKALIRKKEDGCLSLR